MQVKCKRRKLIEENPHCYFCNKEVSYDDSGLFNFNNNNVSYKENGIHIGVMRVLSCLDCIYEKRYSDVSDIDDSNGRNKKRRQKLLDKDPHCHFCRKELDLYNSTLDHLLPRSKHGGGGSNLVLSCYVCNHKKGNKGASAFLKSIKKEKEAKE